MLPKIRRGSTRTVFLTRRYVFKLPGRWEGGLGRTWWRLFLYGLMANMQEREFSKAGWPELCPVTFYVPGGFLVVMRYARPLTNEEWQAFDYRLFVTRGDAQAAEMFDHYAGSWKKDDPWQPLYDFEGGEASPEGGIIPALCFRDSFGVLDGRIVVVDYG